MRPIDESVFVEILENSDADICETYPDNYSKWGFSPSAIKDMLNRTPTISPDSLVKRGRWWKAVERKLDAHTGEYWDEEYYNCLECDYASDWKSPDCPSCGALMED